MSARKSFPCSRASHQSGAAAVEFALISTILFTLLVAIFEFGRLMFNWNAGVEATRLGARLAVVCDLNATAIKTRMQSMLPGLGTGDINVTYLPGGCTADTCQSVTVEIASSSPYIQYSIALAPLSLRIPPLATTLTRESLVSGSGLDANPDC